MKTAGILLAGGASTRFGSPKAFAIWNEKYFYEWALAALQSVCQEVAIVTRAELVKNFPTNLHVITDDEAFLGMGPLAGIYSGMQKVDADQYFVLPCDMPNITGEILETLYDCPFQGDVMAVQTQDTYHPLVSIWQKELKNKLFLELRENCRSVMRFLAKVETTWVDGTLLVPNSANMFQNMNRPEWK
ncbi:molybdenum cofactor guanylyltransferase [Lysinibacillus sp. BW-2-10]|uniref:molybdenum cofactor guanylyltransferase n=1 Tax=Lysinibacillus sp. BW-2-10 TaxID=2590030 RepID=UPI00117FF12C|nr:molybdenum cofactor guanylyltransferase [Lysinibacillus sp. BW-2-10]TSI05199.1 molybdenum cofactor guanylyltransferase [Lysinibacillus sp. BW-2-10]